MTHLQIKNVPEALHQRLREYARQRQCTLSEIMLEALEHELVKSEFRSRLAKRTATELDVTAASLLEEERSQRDEDLSA